MARLIAILPEKGKYGCWSTNVDDFTAVNLSKDEYIEMRAKEAYQDKKEELERDFYQLENGNIYGTIHYKKCLDTIRIVHGILRYNEVKKDLGIKK